MVDFLSLYLTLINPPWPGERLLLSCDPLNAAGRTDVPLLRETGIHAYERTKNYIHGLSGRFFQVFAKTRAMWPLSQLAPCEVSCDHSPDFPGSLALVMHGNPSTVKPVKEAGSNSMTP